MNYENAVKFAQKHIDPYVKSADKKAEFLDLSFKEMGKAGYFKLLIPKEFGGFGGDMKDHSDIVRAFAKSSASAGLCYMMHNVALMTVLTHASKELKDKICKDIVENEVFMALAYSEFGTGTHFYNPEISVKFNENSATFSGKKSMVTSASYASYYAVLARSKEENAIDNWLFPKDKVEFEMSSWDGLGMRPNVSAPMVVKDVTIDNLYRVGDSGSGAKQVFEVVAPYFITGLASVYSGVCEAVLDYSTNYAKDRVYPDGKSLSNIETVQIHLSDIYTKTVASVALTKDAAKSFVNGKDDALAKILAARILASTNAIETAKLAMRVGGGKAYNKIGDIERFLRDAFAGQIMAPSLDVLNVWLGKAITDQQIP